MGDLVQLLPAITDAVSANKDIQFDWVVDESFADIPKLSFGRKAIHFGKDFRHFAFGC